MLLCHFTLKSPFYRGKRLAFQKSPLLMALHTLHFLRFMYKLFPCTVVACVQEN